jgi:hypothetical protein
MSNIMSIKILSLPVLPLKDLAISIPFLTCKETWDLILIPSPLMGEGEGEGE